MITGDYIRLPCFTTKPRFQCIIPCRITSVNNSQLQTEVLQIKRIPTYMIMRYVKDMMPIIAYYY